MRKLFVEFSGDEVYMIKTNNKTGERIYTEICKGNCEDCDNIAGINISLNCKQVHITDRLIDIFNKHYK